MAGQPTEADPAKWHRWFAVEANNRAWRLSEFPARSEAEDAEMLDAAHAAAFHWAKVGTPLHAEHYAAAKVLGGALADAEEKEIFDRMFATVPAPGARHGGA